MSLRMIKGQYIGSLLRLFDLERDVTVITIGDVTFRPERTCTIEKADEFWDDAQKCWMFDVELSCGHRYTAGDVTPCCCECGARAIKEVC